MATKTGVKSPDHVDRHVGARVRIQRTILGMSQEKLGDELGLTFQQVQKYEKGSNRIGAGRLLQIARILGVGVSYFYAGVEESGKKHGATNGGAGAGELIAFMQTRQYVSLAKSFSEIKDERVRSRIAGMVAAIAGGEDARG